MFKIRIKIKIYLSASPKKQLNFLKKYKINIPTPSAKEFEEKIEDKKIDRNGKPAHNKRYTLRRLIGCSGLCSARSFRYAPFPRLTPPTFCPPWKCYAFPYSGGQNVVYLER